MIVICLEELTENERVILSEHLARLRSPARRTTRIAKAFVWAGLSLYLLNVAVQGYRLTQTQGFRDRVALVHEGQAIIQELAQDKKLGAALSSYIYVKRKFNEPFDRRIRHFNFYYRRTKETEREFQEQVQKIYNPLAIAEK
jgi:hypothetical protein